MNHKIKVLKQIKLGCLFVMCCFFEMLAQSQPKTYCNPVNVDYGYNPIPNFSEWGRHRATADPVIVNYKVTSNN